jgi:hypothetical protein
VEGRGLYVLLDDDDDDDVEVEKDKDSAAANEKDGRNMLPEIAGFVEKKHDCIRPLRK